MSDSVIVSRDEPCSACDSMQSRIRPLFRIGRYMAAKVSCAKCDRFIAFSWRWQETPDVAAERGAMPRTRRKTVYEPKIPRRRG